MFSFALKRLPNALNSPKNSAISSIIGTRSCSSENTIVQSNPNVIEGEFRQLELYPSKAKANEKKQRKQYAILPPRYKRMNIKQKWSNVWSGPRSFHPATVPLPIRQGYLEPRDNRRPPPDKFANAELMKIPNFLHLTPPAIEQQCAAIKKYCTKWPAGLETDEQCDKHFPIEYISTDYVQGLPTIRNPLSRIISIRFKLSALPFDEHAKDKFLRLVENRYDPNTDIVTITVDRCPVRIQNFEYAQYVLTALFHESFVREPWETLKSEADMEYYDWDKNKSKETLMAILQWGKSKDEPIKSMDGFARSVEKLFNEGENEMTIQEYKEETLKILGLKN